MSKIAIFASGTGSNFDAIVGAIEQGDLQAQATLLVCDNSEAAVIEKAKGKGIDYFLFSASDFPNKESYEEAILKELEAYEVEWLILAGYMRLLGPTLLDAYPNKIINIHPSLLPKYKGKDAIKRAYEAGEREIGVSIHYVDEGMDTGELIAQEAITLTGEESLDEVTERIHRVEHRLYPETLAKLLEQ